MLVLIQGSSNNLETLSSLEAIYLVQPYQTRLSSNLQEYIQKCSLPYPCLLQYYPKPIVAHHSHPEKSMFVLMITPQTANHD